MVENPESTIENSERVALVIQYVGTNFHGWQRQPNRRTVQEEIENAIAQVLGYRASLIGAGRTDSGVHAAAQVAHFTQKSLIPACRWSAVLNGRLPDDISISASAKVSQNWHARFSALWRRYRYTIYNDKRPNLFVKPFSWHYYDTPLQESLMRSALTTLLGKHHLAAFHRSQSQRRHSWVDVQEVECYRQGSAIAIEIQANAFLYGMVRLLVGMLVEVGSGKRSLENFVDIWVNQQRDKVKYAAPAKGLCLLRVGYSEFPFPPNIWYDTQPIYHFNY